VKKHNPKNVKVATLFFKPHAYQKKIKPDYVGMNVPDKFLLGYGLDFDGLGRNLKDVYVLNE
jgi:hypoxanthine-guanine phosphoribosyltransferase